MSTPTTASSERNEIAEKLANQRSLLRRSVDGITEEQAAARTTVSELCLGGIIKHVAAVEERWARFVVEGSSAMFSMDQAGMDAHAASFHIEPGETLASLLADYERVASASEILLHSLESLDSSQPLPEAPWFPPGGRWSARQVFLHILAETAQHCGHADIIRESLDGAKSMG
jgi:hypothetical protein